MYRYMAVVAVVLLCIPSAHELGQALRRALRAQVVETPRGKVTYLSYAAAASARKTVTWLTAAPAQDRFFFYPYLQMLPFLVHNSDRFMASLVGHHAAAALRATDPLGAAGPLLL